MAPGLMKVPKPIPPVVMYKQVPAPRSMAPSWDDDGSGTYRKYINKPNNPPRHHQILSSRGLEEEQETDRTSRISSTSSFGLHSLFGSVSGSPRLLGTSHEIYTTPHNIQGSIPGQTATGIPPRTPATQSFASASANFQLTAAKSTPAYKALKQRLGGSSSASRVINNDDLRERLANSRIKAFNTPSTPQTINITSGTQTDMRSSIHREIDKSAKGNKDVIETVGTSGPRTKPVGYSGGRKITFS